MTIGHFMKSRSSNLFRFGHTAANRLLKNQTFTSILTYEIKISIGDKYVSCSWTIRPIIDFSKVNNVGQNPYNFIKPSQEYCQTVSKI